MLYPSARSELQPVATMRVEPSKSFISLIHNLGWMPMALYNSSLSLILTAPLFKSARVKSYIKSSTFSIPMHNLIKSSGKSLSSLVFESIEACDILHGIEINELTHPKETAMPKMSVDSTIFSDILMEPVSKLNTAPAPLHWL